MVNLLPPESAVSGARPDGHGGSFLTIGQAPDIAFHDNTETASVTCPRSLLTFDGQIARLAQGHDRWLVRRLVDGVGLACQVALARLLG